MRSFEKHAGPNFRTACDALGINASAQNTMGAQRRYVNRNKQASVQSNDSILFGPRQH